MNDTITIVPAPRPADGSPEDLEAGRRAMNLQELLDWSGWVAGSVLPGSPPMTEEVQARIAVLQLAAEGDKPLGEALAIVRRRFARRPNG